MSRYNLDTLPKRAMNTIARYPKQAAVLAGLALLFIANSSDSTNRVGASETTTQPTAPFQSEDAGWLPRYTVKTAAGALLDIACRGTTTITVEEGQTLSELAATIDTTRLGVDLPDIQTAELVQVLVDANDIRDKNLIYPEQDLYLPVECTAMDVSVG